jgi:hypothetical protein
MSDDQRSWYMRGYNRGRQRKWPEHNPPIPPGVVGELTKAAVNLRDEVDKYLAQLEESDPLQNVLGGAIDRLNLALESVSPAEVPDKIIHIEE